MAYANGTRARARKTSKTTDERRATAAALKDRLTQWQADADPGLIAMALATHDGYSQRNACLVAMQDPEATDVRGYRAWQDAGRQVAAGTHGIMIIGYRGDDAGKAKAGAPDGEEAGGEEKVSRFFAPTTVHDVRHTIPLACDECGEAVHRTGYDKEARRHQWTHTTVKADHEARPARPDGNA